MRNKTIYTITTLGVLLTFLMVGCTADDPGHPKDWNGSEANNSNYGLASAGNSLTAGYMDGALLMIGQQGSFPLLVANAFNFEYGGTVEFDQPYIDAPGIGGVDSEDPSQVLGTLFWNTTTSAIERIGTFPLAEAQSKLLAAALPTPYHNMGIPGATVTTANNGLTSVDTGNPFFDFILRNGPEPPDNSFMANTTMGTQAGAKSANIYTFWIGNNDVLGPATSGNPVAGDFISAQGFTEQLNSLASKVRLTAFSINGFPPLVAYANIPPITASPYFVPFAVFDGIYQGIYAGGGLGPFPGYDEADIALVRFPALGWIQEPANIGTSLPSEYTLTNTEKDLVEQWTATYNGITAGFVDTGNLSGFPSTLVDVFTIMSDLAAEPLPNRVTHFQFLVTPVAMGGFGMTVEEAAAFTYFSLDGLHPNNLGYGVIANAFIAKFNEALGTSAAEIPISALSWDPTYSALQGKVSGSASEVDALESMDLIFRY